jgi:hypothetical protein
LELNHPQTLDRAREFYLENREEIEAERLPLISTPTLNKATVEGILHVCHLFADEIRKDRNMHDKLGQRLQVLFSNPRVMLYWHLACTTAKDIDNSYRTRDGVNPREFDRLSKSQKNGQDLIKLLRSSNTYIFLDDELIDFLFETLDAFPFSDTDRAAFVQAAADAHNHKVLAEFKKRGYTIPDGKIGGEKLLLKAVASGNLDNVLTLQEAGIKLTSQNPLLTESLVENYGRDPFYRLLAFRDSLCPSRKMRDALDRELISTLRNSGKDLQALGPLIERTERTPHNPTEKKILDTLPAENMYWTPTEYLVERALSYGLWELACELQRKLEK